MNVSSHFIKVQKYLIILFSTLGLNSCSSVENNPSINTGHFLKDSTLVVLSDRPSPVGKTKYVEYCFDNGGLGYSRVFWAIAPIDDANFDLSKGLVPDGYKIVEWTSDNKLILEKWEPYYYKSEDVDLKTGMNLLGVEIIVND